MSTHKKRARFPWPTNLYDPDTPRPRCVRINLFDDPEWTSIFWGNFYQLTQWYAHEIRDPNFGEDFAAQWQIIYDEARARWLANECNDAEPARISADQTYVWPASGLHGWVFDLDDNNNPCGIFRNGRPETEFYVQNFQAVFGIRMYREFGGDFWLRGAGFDRGKAKTTLGVPVFPHGVSMKMWAITTDDQRVDLVETSLWDTAYGVTTTVGFTLDNEHAYVTRTRVKRAYFEFILHEGSSFPNLEYVEDNAGWIDDLYLRWQYLPGETPPT